MGRAVIYLKHSMNKSWERAKDLSRLNPLYRERKKLISKEIALSGQILPPRISRIRFKVHVLPLLLTIPIQNDLMVNL